MGFVRVAPLALFLLATSMMFWMKKIEAADCSGSCAVFDRRPCGSSDCLCLPKGIISGSCISAKKIDEHPNICQTHEECTKKGSGNFCARYPNDYMDYGWCFNSDSEELKGFLAMPTTISK